MCKDNLVPNINDGRFFVSPILGCTGACSYCYLKIKDYHSPHKNNLSIEEILGVAQQSPNFVFGPNGTIISVGAWGDIFPLGNTPLILHSIKTIKNLLSWGNPVQIMSKNTLDDNLVHELTQEIQYPGQLLYSTTITTIDNWKSIEPGTASPIERLNTAFLFHQAGIPTNVLLKPFIPKLTGLELPRIADLLLEYQVDYCTLGIMYWSPEISNKVMRNNILRETIDLNSFSSTNHLDCNGDVPLISTPTTTLAPHINYLRERGIKAFFKSSCVNSNIMNIPNASNYFFENSSYCINCGNCRQQLESKPPDEGS